MLNDETICIRKSIRERKTLKSTELFHQTCGLDLETK